MGFVARSRRKMWFGTEEYATWIPTPNSGADSSPQAWNESGTFLGGDGYAIGSRNSHKQYVYEWPSSSSREDAQLMKSFYEGTYGRGKLYFVEPLIYDTNVLPAKWANPAITCGFEGPSLVPGVDPAELTRADAGVGYFDLEGVREPLASARYSLTDVPGTPASFTPVYENFFTNPRLKGDGTWAPVYENFFTNPRLVGADKTEVRRNWVRDPRFEVPGSNWTSSLWGITTQGGGSITLESLLPLEPLSDVLVPDAAWTNGVTGVASAGYVVENLSSTPATFRIRFSNGSAFSTSNPVPVGPGETKPVTFENVAIPAGSPYFQPRLVVEESYLPVGTKVRVSEPIFENSAHLDPYFDGDTPDTRMDEYAWTGAENASESVKLSNAVEVRRNHAQRPIADSNWEPGSYGVGGSGSAFTAEVGGTSTRVVAWSAKPTGGTASLRLGWVNSIPAGKVEASVRVVITGASNPSAYMFAEWLTESEDYISVSSSADAPVSSDPSDPTTLLFSSTPPAGAAKGRFHIRIPPASIEVGTRLYASSFMLGSGDYFDGSTTPETLDGIVQPEDFRIRWLGAENASESVMEIEQVAGLSGVNAIAGVSTWEGKPAVRVIPTGSSNQSLVIASFPAPAPIMSAVGTVSLIEPLQGELNPSALSLGLGSGLDTAPNLLGSHFLRVSGVEISGSSMYLALSNGASQGSGDVWWTDIGLYAGNYPYDTFNGESDPADTGIAQPEDFRIRWTGEVDNSTSMMEIERVAGVSAHLAIAGVSTMSGKPAIRVIPTSATVRGASVMVTIPNSIRSSTWTAVGTSHIPKELTDGPINPGAIRAEIAPWTYLSQGVTPPNGPGTAEQRLVYDPSTNGIADTVGFRQGGLVGSGDVWWTDIGLFSGDYGGPVFSGSDGSVTIDGIPYSTRWVGASDFSVSQAGIWTTDNNITLDDRNSVFIPIPEGMQLNIGANFREIGSDRPGIYLKPISDTPSNNIYPVGQAFRSNLFPLVIPAMNGIRGVRMWIGKLGSSGNPSTLIVNFIHARLSPLGKTPTGPDHWIGGQGHAGTRFALPPTYISNTGVGGGQISYAATFKESLI